LHSKNQTKKKRRQKPIGNQKSCVYLKGFNKAKEKPQEIG